MFNADYNFFFAFHMIFLFILFTSSLKCMNIPGMKHINFFLIYHYISFNDMLFQFKR